MALAPEQLEAGYSQAKRQFATYGSILRRSLGLPGAFKRVAYNVAWIRSDPLWVAIIRAGLMPLATRIFERVLQLSTRAPGQEHSVMPYLMNASAREPVVWPPVQAPVDAPRALVTDNCQQPSLTLIRAGTPDYPDSESAFARVPAESGQKHQRSNPGGNRQTGGSKGGV